MCFASELVWPGYTSKNDRIMKIDTFKFCRGQPDGRIIVRRPKRPLPSNFFLLLLMVILPSAGGSCPVQLEPAVWGRPCTPNVPVVMPWQWRHSRKVGNLFIYLSYLAGGESTLCNIEKTERVFY